MKTGITGALSLALTLSAAVSGWAQEKVGVVTTVVGPVTVARASLPPEPLKFRDDVFVRDRVTTGEQGITRILLGGKVIITAREHSTLTITETPGLSTIHLTSGRIAVAVERSRMKSGERVDIRTPNAVAGVRGTVLIVEAETNLSTVTVLRGLVHVTRLNSAGALVGRFTAVGARQTVTVRNNVLPARSKTITPSRVQELSQDFTPPLKPVKSAAVVPESDEIKPVLAKSDASVSRPAANVPAKREAKDMDSNASTTPAAPSTGAVVAAPVPAAAPVAVAAPPVAAPPVSSPPVLSIAPAVPTTPALPTTPVTPVVTPPAPAPVPTAIKTKLPNLSTSWKRSSSKVDKDDRSGSNSGRR